MSEYRKQQLGRDPVIPDKLYFRIGEVSRLLGVETHTLRFWETEFPQLKVGKGGTGQRLYRRRDVELVLEIKHLLYEQGYTIPGARQFLQQRLRCPEPKHQSQAATPAPAPSGPKLAQLRSELQDLSALLANPAASEAAKAGRRARTRPGLESTTRGLHLAPDSAAKSTQTETIRPLPSLFDPEES